jgi:hypothetical protein
MNRLIQLNKATGVFFVVLGLGCFCLSPLAQAQGCSSTCISNNAGFGQQALSNNTTGDQNTAAGAGALLRNTTGLNNTATGFGALAANTTESANTANGYNALNFNSGTSNKQRVDLPTEFRATCNS